LAGKVTAGLVENNGSLLPEMTLKVTCRLTACTLGSALGPTLGNEYGKTFLPLLLPEQNGHPMTKGTTVTSATYNNTNA